jgi:hypothetical protein
LIYDDKCYSCGKFARISNTLSRGWIRTAGHYYSQEALDAKKRVFPPGYDSTKMFWIVNKTGAYGARSGLPQLAKEIVFGMFAGHESRAHSDSAIGCEYKESEMSCDDSTSILKRIARLLSHGATFRF